MTTSTTATSTTATEPAIRPDPTWHPRPEAVRRALAKRSFATLSTTSPKGRPHAAGVLYVFNSSELIINTLRSSRKAKNIKANPNVGVCVPVRRLPVGPPSSIQFQATAQLLDLDDPEIVPLLESGELKSLTSHGELDEPDGCFVRIAIGPRMLTYGLGMSVRALIADPLHAAGIVDLTT